MRKITEQSVNAFNNKKNFKSGNTEVFYSPSQDATYLTLHGNTIAIQTSTKLMISNCGWFTNTTKERLNGLNEVQVVQRKGIWYLNGEEWDGELTEV